MKQWKWLMLTVFMALVWIQASPGFAVDGQTYTENDITYTEYSGKYTVTSYTGTDTQINIPDLVNGKIVDKVGDYAFSGKTTITSISLPDTITTIGENAFYNCSGLTSLILSDGVTSIGSGAFQYCTGLTSLTVPSGVTSIPESAFSGCSSLTSLTLPSGLTTIGEIAFDDCSGLTSLMLPNTLTSIGNAAFSGCSGLTSLTIPSGVTSISSSTFYGCSGLTSLTLPSAMTSIGPSAFSQCSSLTSITIPSGVTNIGDSAFYGCSGLTSLTIPSNLTSIGDYTFSGCSSLTSLILPSGLTTIGEASFEGCSGLTSLSIPSSVTSIARYAFQNCSGLTSLTIPNSLTSISDYAFYHCSGLTSLTIPESVTSIGSGAFSRCSGLTSLTIPSSVTGIGNSAFAGCSGLTSLTIPASVSSISDYAFSNCSGLTSLTIPSGVTSIESYAFSNCSGLTSLTIPSSVSSIVSNAFDNSGLQTIYGYSGSYVESFASSIGKTFVSLGRMEDQFFTIKYVTNTTTLIDDTIIQWNTYLPNIPTLTKEGYVFSGWYKDRNFITPFDAGVAPIRWDLTLYAKWLIEVKFDAMGGSPIATQELLSPGKVMTPSIAPRIGYTFEGWYREKTFLNKWNFDVDVAAGSMTLYAKWIPNKYVITFSSAYGTPILPVEVDYDTLCTEPEKPTQRNYTFIGWYRDAAFSLLWDFSTNKVTTDRTLYAKWQEKQVGEVSVLFDSAGGTTIPGRVQLTNTLISTPTAPTRTGYTFAGWYKEASYTNAWNFSTDLVTTDTTLYAKWTINQYTVSFSSEGGSSVAPKTTDYNTLISAPAAPTRTGYTFGGWYKEASYINAWDFMSDKVTTDVTLYAKWTIIQYTVSFNSQGGSSVAPKTTDYNTLISAPAAPTRTGYTFGGWYKEASYINAWEFTTDKVTTDITLYAKWTINQYTVNFDSQGGSTVSSKTADYNTLITAPTAPVRMGYTFAGWYKEAEYTNAWNFTTDVVTKDTTLYAKWTLNQYTVNFDSQGGSGVAPKTTDYNTSISAPAEPIRTGYTFSGWFKELTLSNAWNFTTDKVTTNTTLYAKWTINQYTVTFDSQGGSVTYPVSTDFNTLISAPYAPTRMNYTFAGWYKESSHTNLWDFSTDMVTEDTTLYAKWNIITYIVDWVGGPGANNMPPSQEVEINGLLTKPPVPTRGYQTFAGWYTDSALTTPYDFTKPVLSSFTLYAKWVPGTYLYFWVDGSTSTVPRQYIKFMEYTQKPTDPVKTGFRFAGWYTDQTYKTEFTFGKLMPYLTVIYAKWEIMTYTVDWVGGPGANDMPSSKVLEANALLTKPPVPTRGYQTFAGWFTDSALTTPYDFTQPVLSNLTLYAKWVPGTYLYFWVDGSTSTVPRQYIKFMEYSKVPVAPTKAGSTFGGWYEDQAYMKPYQFNTLLPYIKVVYAKWNPEGQFSVDWIGGPGANQMPPAQLVTQNTLLAKPPVPTRGYQTFAGWYTDSALTKAYDFTKPVTTNLVLYAKWIPGTYLYFWVDGNTSVVPRQYIKYQEYTIRPTDPVKEGYTFAGWYEDQAYTRPYTFNTLLPYMKVVYAKWDPVAESQVAPAEAMIESTIIVVPVEAETTEPVIETPTTEPATTEPLLTEPVTTEPVSSEPVPESTEPSLEETTESNAE